MSLLEIIHFENSKNIGIKDAETELSLWLQKPEIEVLRWQLISILYPYKVSPQDENHYFWKSYVDLVIEYKKL